MKDNEKTYRIGEKIILEDDLTLQYAGTDKTQTYKKGSVLYAMKNYIKLPDGGNYWKNKYATNGYNIDGMLEYIENRTNMDYLEEYCDEDEVARIKESLAEALAELLGE